MQPSKQKANKNMTIHLRLSYVAIIIAAALLMPITGAGTAHRVKQCDPRRHCGRGNRIDRHQKMMCRKRAYEFAETQNTTYDSGDSYYGEINGEGKRHGKGVYRWLSGETYQGEWKHDSQHGFGEFKYADGKSRYSGEWYNGKEHGIGTYIGENLRGHVQKWSHTRKWYSQVCFKRRHVHWRIRE
mmetsp:Transcript_6554/g.10255  ORF Transcript_6554/g.10255 Transcript_6554/m.10255 type:complete len:185 (+) Transcript_6554:137-691(+)